MRTKIVFALSLLGVFGLFSCSNSEENGAVNYSSKSDELQREKSNN